MTRTPQLLSRVRYQRSKPNCIVSHSLFNHIFLLIRRKYVSVVNEKYVLDQWEAFSHSCTVVISFHFLLQSSEFWRELLVSLQQCTWNSRVIRVVRYPLLRSWTQFATIWSDFHCWMQCFYRAESKSRKFYWTLKYFFWISIDPVPQAMKI